jgi:predicted lipoprotein with Yx(FWY)xxD motif
MRLLVLLVWVFALPVAAQTPVAGFTPGSFRVTEGGAAEYRIPLRVPPGIAGMEPKLALAYNSQAGNGLLGVGWNLEGLSAITRCPRTMAQDGARGGVNYDANDRYCLDGQRLVAISGSYGADGTEYRTERESFSKIVSHGQAGSGPAWFKVWTKAGQILEYGNSADSRIEIQANDTVRTWAVNRVSDRKGNSIVTTYFEDRANGEYRPASVAYGSNHMTFGYAGRPDATPLYDGGGSKVLAAHLLTQVRTFVSGVLVKDYRLAYGQGTTTLRSRLNTVQECDADANCLPATALAWRPETPGINAVLNTTQVWADDWRALYQVHPGDFNGDGITDIWMTGFNGGFFCPGPGIASANNCAQVWHDDWRPLYQIHTGDFNGDGSTDLWMMGFNGEFFAAGGSRADLVASISASSGVAASITYRPLTDSAVYTKGAGSSYPIADLTLPLHAVSSVTTGNGQGGSNTVNYAYAGLRAASNGRGLLGFSRTSATSVASALKTTATYRQEFPLTGLPCEVRQERVDATSGASIALIARTRTTYGLKTADALGALSDVALPAGDACPASSSSWYAASQTPGATRHFFPYAARSLESTYDLNGVALPEVTTETSYDAYGNPASINVCAGDGHSKATTNTFAGPDLGNWQLGLLSRSTVRSPSPIPCP